MKIIETHINQDLVRQKWIETEWKDKRDESANVRLNRFLKNEYKINLIEVGGSDFETIYLPEHAHEYIKCNTETSLATLVKRFEKNLPDSTINDCCYSRIIYILDYFNSASTNKSFLEGKFMFITKNLNLSVKSNYNNSGFYTGSFHQFAAYALWIVINGYKPIRLYLIE